MSTATNTASADAQAETYPKDWARVDLMVSPEGVLHALGGDQENDKEGAFIGLARILETIRSAQPEGNRVNLERLKEIIDREFAPPYTAEGLVQATWTETKMDGRVLALRIDRRDIWLNKDGEVVGAGTLIKDKPHRVS